MTETSDEQADAARYVVLRKLASGMRHVLMGELQSVLFSAEFAAKGLATGTPVETIVEHLNKIVSRTKTAVTTSQSIFEWLRPQEGSTITLDEALEQCRRLAGDDWSLRGIAATTRTTAGGISFPKAATLELVVTSLLALIDAHPGPANIDVSAEHVDDELVLRLHAQRSDRTSVLPPMSLYRPLTNEDVRAVADLHGVACAFADGQIEIRLRPSGP